MILYHTSDREIRNPDIHYGRKNADFGWGFYLTPDREFTYRWKGWRYTGSPGMSAGFSTSSTTGG